MGGTGETSRESTSTLPAWVESIVLHDLHIQLPAGVGNDQALLA